MSETVPWDELEPFEKDMMTQLLHARGIDVGVEEAERFYGNPELVEQEASR